MNDDLLPRLLKSETRLVYPRFPFEIYGIFDGMPAAEAGVLPGDKVVALNGDSISFYDEFQGGAENAKHTPMSDIDLGIVPGWAK